MIVLTDEQAITVHRLLTCILLNETYRLTGMADQSRLNRHLKRIFGIPPEQYRRMSTSFETK